MNDAHTDERRDLTIVTYGDTSMFRELLAAVVLCWVCGCGNAHDKGDAGKIRALKANGISRIHIRLENVLPSVEFDVPPSEYERFVNLFGGLSVHPDPKKWCIEGNITVTTVSGDQIRLQLFSTHEEKAALSAPKGETHEYYMIGPETDVRQFIVDTAKAATGKDIKMGCGE